MRRNHPMTMKNNYLYLGEGGNLTWGRADKRMEPQAEESKLREKVRTEAERMEA